MLASFPLADAEQAQKPTSSQSFDVAATPSTTRELLAQGGEISIVPIDLPSVRRFYGARDFRPVWTGDSNVSNAELVRTVLENADKEGLEPTDYHTNEVSLIGRRTAWDAAQIELLLTDGLVRYARDVRLGRAPLRALDRDIDLPAQEFDAVAALETALANGALRPFLAGLPPPQPEYAALRSQLEKLRGISARGGWPILPVSPSARADISGPDLQARLIIEDPALQGVEVSETDIAVLQALIHFQARHGLEPDGKLGPRTIEALNTPVADRIAQVTANMERWRWLPRSFEPNYIAVNVPDATLKAVRDNKVVLTSRVVVGRPNSRTPVLRADATGITVNPAWDVPMSIARKEYLPALRRDPRFLARQRIIIVNAPPGDPSGEKIDWASIKPREFGFHLRQAPGLGNALGSLKLEMPNKFDIYLHDTPNTKFFARNERALSHGCMRVEQILALASVALAGDPTAALDQLNQAIATGATEELPLANPLPVYALYWTAFVADSGELEFRRDLYGRDARLFAALHSPVAISGPVAQLGTCPATG